MNEHETAQANMWTPTDANKRGYFVGLKYWQKLDNQAAWLIYAGKENQARQNIQVLGWPNIDELPSSYQVGVAK